MYTKVCIKMLQFPSFDSHKICTLCACVCVWICVNGWDRSTYFLASWCYSKLKGKNENPKYTIATTSSESSLSMQAKANNERCHTHTTNSTEISTIIITNAVVERTLSSSLPYTPLCSNSIHAKPIFCLLQCNNDITFHPSRVLKTTKAAHNRMRYNGSANVWIPSVNNKIQKFGFQKRHIYSAVFTFSLLYIGIVCIWHMR